MISYIVIISFICLVLILAPRYVQVVSGRRQIENDGLSEFLQNSTELYLYIKRAAKQIKKLSIQYTFHFIVRMLYCIKLFSDNLYSSARNKFMKNTMGDKRAVARFWDYLKEYKTEIDAQKEQN